MVLPATTDSKPPPNVACVRIMFKLLMLMRAGTVNTKMLLAGWGPCGIEIEVPPPPAPQITYWRCLE